MQYIVFINIYKTKISPSEKSKYFLKNILTGFYFISIYRPVNKIHILKNSIGGKGNMANVNVPSDVSVSDFFEKHVPVQFKEIVTSGHLSSLAGKEISLQYNLNDQKYCLKIKNGTELEVVKGDIDNPLLTLALSDQVFLDSVNGKLAGTFDRFTDPAEIANPVMLRNLTETKGTLNLTLKHDGNSIPATMIFNGEAKPVVDISLELQDWQAMQKKQATGQGLFMNGKLKFTGDMAFLMKLQTLI
jgi:putative sterol carrier protein